MDEQRLNFLFVGHCTGVLSESEEEELAVALEGAPALRRQLAWQKVVERLLREAPSTHTAAAQVMAALPRVPGDTMNRVMRDLPNRPRGVQRARIAAGSMLAAAAAALLLVARPVPKDEGVEVTSSVRPVAGTASGKADPTPSLLAWTISAVEGDVRRGALPAAVGDRLRAGDLLRTAAIGSGAILLGDDERVELGAGTVVEVAPNDSEAWGSLRAGSALINTSTRPGRRPFVLLTGQAKIATTGARFAVTADARQTRVDTWRGRVQVRAARGGAETVVEAKQSALVATGADTVGVVASDRRALLVIGTVNKNGRVDGDQRVRQRLENAHFSVTAMIDKAVTTTALRAASLVVVSSSVELGVLGEQLRDLAVPVVVAEPWLLDGMGMTEAGNEDNQANYGQDLVIVREDHPLAAGLSGTVGVATASSIIAWGRPNAVATTVATVDGKFDNAAIFGYEKGDAMPGLLAPARRVFVYIHDGTATRLTSAGWALFDAAIEWAAASP